MIEARALVKRYETTEILRGVTLHVRPFEVAAIIGSSGSGKSTFLRCLNGLEPFHGGELRVGDERLAPGPYGPASEAQLRRVRRRLGMVFQQFHLFPHLTVLGNVIFAPCLVLGLSKEAAIERARALLERVGLGGKLDQRPSQLSGGEQQRVAIARALAMEPECLLFDEPTSALDPQMAGEVLAVMRDLAAQKQTMVVVTHAMDFARRAASTVHVFDRGIVIESGPPERIFEAPEHEATRALLREAWD